MWFYNVAPPLLPFQRTFIALARNDPECAGARAPDPFERVQRVFHRVDGSHVKVLRNVLEGEVAGVGYIHPLGCGTLLRGNQDYTKRSLCAVDGSRRCVL